MLNLALSLILKNPHPVGNAFEYIENNYPNINLYMDDNKHPSPNATYLASCVFYSMITGKSPVGMPRRFEGKNSDGKKIYYIITERNTAPIIQKVADIITKDFRWIRILSEKDTQYLKSCFD